MTQKSQNHDHDPQLEKQIEIDLAELDRALSEAMPTEAPGDLSDRIFAQTEQAFAQRAILARIGARPKDPIHLHKALAMAAALLLLVGLIFVLKSSLLRGPAVNNDQPTAVVVQPIDESEFDEVDDLLTRELALLTASEAAELDLDIELAILDLRLSTLAMEDEFFHTINGTDSEPTLDELLQHLESQSGSF